MEDKRDGRLPAMKTDDDGYLICPACEGTKWIADYNEAVHQDVAVGFDDLTGEPEIFDYLGGTKAYDNGDGEVETVTCNCCHYTIRFGHTEYIKNDEPAEDLSRMSDAERTLYLVKKQ